MPGREVCKSDNKEGEYEEDKKDPMVRGDTTVNDWMMRRCMELEATVKSLQREIW